MNGMLSILDKIDKDGLVRFTRDIVRIRSVFDPEREGFNEFAAAEFIAGFLEKEGFDVHFEEVVPGRPNVIAILNGDTEGKAILFEGHTDVVTAGNPAEWHYDPFGAEIVDGRLYGRGACDTKGNVAAAIFAVKAIKDSGAAFSGKIVLCIPCDEEGMMIGIKDFIARGWADDIDGAVICEPEENQLCIFQKGAMRVAIDIYGKQSHGAMPLAGINPNWRLGRLLIELERLEQMEKDRLGEHAFLGLPSITPTIIRAPYAGEAQINVVPGDVYMTLDIRTIPGQDHEELIDRIRDIFRQLKEDDSDFNASMTVIESRPWTETPKDAPIVSAAQKAYTDATGKEAILNGVPGATDGTYLASLKNIPVVVTGAGGRTIPHQVDEYVRIDELIETCRMYALTAIYFLNGIS